MASIRTRNESAMGIDTGCPECAYLSFMRTLNFIRKVRENFAN